MVHSCMAVPEDVVSQDDIVWVKVELVNLSGSCLYCACAVLHCRQVIEVKEDEGKFRRTLRGGGAIFHNFSQLFIFFGIGKPLNSDVFRGLDMRFVGQKDGEDQDPGNVQVGSAPPHWFIAMASSWYTSEIKCPS